MKGYQLSIEIVNNNTGKLLFSKILPESLDMSLICYSQLVETLAFLYHPQRIDIVFKYSEYDEIKQHG